MFKCPLCEKEYEKLISLSAHFKREHKGTAKELVLILFYDGVEPTCACGCGGEVKFLGLMRRFREYIRGHVSRVPGKNNWGHNKTALKNSQKTRRQMIEDETWKPFFSKETGEHWAKGLTKETDERIANMSKSITSNEELMKKHSDRMRQGRLDGTIPTLYKQDHSQWKGGVSNLSAICRTNKRLHWDWKFPLLKSANFICEECYGGTKDKLEIHHDKETMSFIINKFAKEYNWEDTLLNGKEEDILELKYKISDMVVQYHVNNKVSGQVLCRVCHKKKHKSYNLK